MTRLGPVPPDVTNVRVPGDSQTGLLAATLVDLAFPANQPPGIQNFLQGWAALLGLEDPTAAVATTLDLWNILLGGISAYNTTQMQANQAATAHVLADGSQQVPASGGGELTVAWNAATAAAGPILGTDAAGVVPSWFTIDAGVVVLDDTPGAVYLVRYGHHLVGDPADKGQTAAVNNQTMPLLDGTLFHGSAVALCNAPELSALFRADGTGVPVGLAIATTAANPLDVHQDYTWCEVTRLRAPTPT